MCGRLVIIFNNTTLHGVLIDHATLHVVLKVHTWLQHAVLHVGLNHTALELGRAINRSINRVILYSLDHFRTPKMHIFHFLVINHRGGILQPAFIIVYLWLLLLTFEFIVDFLYV